MSCCLSRRLMLWRPDDLKLCWRDRKLLWRNVRPIVVLQRFGMLLQELRPRKTNELGQLASSPPHHDCQGTKANEQGRAESSTDSAPDQYSFICWTRGDCSRAVAVDSCWVCTCRSSTCTGNGRICCSSKEQCPDVLGHDGRAVAAAIVPVGLISTAVFAFIALQDIPHGHFRSATPICGCLRSCQQRQAWGPKEELHAVWTNVGASRSKTCAIGTSVHEDEPSTGAVL